jgi:hypothetical protein
MGKGLHTIIQEKNKVQLAAWCEQKTGFFYGYSELCSFSTLNAEIL